MLEHTLFIVVIHSCFTLALHFEESIHSEINNEHVDVVCTTNRTSKASEGKAAGPGEGGDDRAATSLR